MELTYTQAGDYLIPIIATPATPHHMLGKYGKDLSWMESFFEDRDVYVRQFIDEEISRDINEQ